MVEGAKRQKTPNEIGSPSCSWRSRWCLSSGYRNAAALTPLYSVEVAKLGTPITITALIALLVCLIPTTIGGLLSAIGVAGMSRMMAGECHRHVRPAVEAAGDVDVLLWIRQAPLRSATVRHPLSSRDGCVEEELADTAQLASLATRPLRVAA